jgi:hypothetical protein
MMICIGLCHMDQLTILLLCARNLHIFGPGWLTHGAAARKYRQRFSRGLCHGNQLTYLFALLRPIYAACAGADG